jgi:hypothetical protein
MSGGVCRAGKVCTVAAETRRATAQPVTQSLIAYDH